ncbi:unnamed protein product [Hyaloperonospora brassicae]|uniref:RxLR effector candidate protein n=1 Tax=Hyaloperonospora brassicae TaxID=162125 RepID=A0AAV0UE70_HYABA|nr:unnamed protein product [Hyaloperonospora brassicae]
MLAAVLAPTRAVTERVPSTRATSDVASGTATEPKGVSKSFMSGGDQPDERANISPLSIASSLKNLLERSRVEIANSFRVRQWLRSKQTVYDVFLRLKLNAGLDESLLSPHFYTWINFVDIFNKHHPNNKVSAALVLSWTYTDLVLARKSEALIEKSDQIGTRLAREQREKWRDAKHSADAVFELLKLHEPGLNIFERPELNAWCKFVLFMERENARKVMASVVSRYYSADEFDKLLLGPKLDRSGSQRAFVELGTAFVRQQSLKRSSNV